MKAYVFLYMPLLLIAGSAMHEAFHTHQFSALGIGTYEMCVLGMHHGGNIGGWTTPAVTSAQDAAFLEGKRPSLESSAYLFQFGVIAVGIAALYLRKRLKRK